MQRRSFFRRHGGVQLDQPSSWLKSAPPVRASTSPRPRRNPTQGSLPPTKQINAPSPPARGVKSRGTTLFQPPEAALPAGNGAKPFRPTAHSGGKLREQSSTGLPHRLAASAGSLEAGGPVFLPFKVFIPALFYGEFSILSRGGGKYPALLLPGSPECSDMPSRPPSRQRFPLDKLRQNVYYKGTITHYIGNPTERTAFPWN